LKVNHNPRRALEYTVRPQEGGNSPLPPGTRESWIYIEGVDDFSTSENGATEQVKTPNPRPVQAEVDPENQSPAEHLSDETTTSLEKLESQPRIDFVAAPGLTERKTEEKAMLKNEIKHSLSDAEEAWVEADSEPPRTGRTRRVALRKRKTRSRSGRRARSMSPTRNQISQFGEIVSRLPWIENVQGDVHMNITICPVTHVHGGYQGGAAPTAAVPQVGTVTFVNSNNTCACAQHVAETDGGSCHLSALADSSGN
jgi:hypothetical protein